MPSPRRAYAAWIAVCLIWGTTYLGIRIALETIPPFLMAALRWLVSGTIIAAFLKARGERLPPVRAWKTLAVLGLLMLGFGNGGVVWAERTVSSGLTAVLVAASPFWMVGVEAFMRGGERPTSRQILGLVVGFGGIVLLVWPDLGIAGGGAGPGFLGGVIATQLACLGWAVGSAYSKRHAREDNVLAVVSYEMLFGAAFFIVAASVRHEFAQVTFTVRTTAALVYLIVVGGIGGFSSYAYALKHLRVATVSLYAYINPVIAVVLGVLVLDEAFSARMALAAAVVLAGVVLVRQEPAPAS